MVSGVKEVVGGQVGLLPGGVELRRGLIADGVPLVGEVGNQVGDGGNSGADVAHMASGV